MAGPTPRGRYQPLTRRHYRILSLLAVIILLSLYFIVPKIRPFLAHVTRPIWDRPPRPWQYITNYGWRLPAAETCELYGFTERTEIPRLMDTFLFNNELDMLEIRLNELNDVVDLFILVESTRTFTDQEKDLVYDLHKNDSRFAPFAHKIKHIIVRNTSDLKSMKKGMQKENWARNMLWVEGIEPIAVRGDLVLHADLDEIPRPDVLNMMKYCQGFPSPVYLEMQRYLYSFEFPISKTDVTAVWTFDPDFPTDLVSHRRRGDTAIYDSGWHCSFCFKYIEDFVNKMNSYSHWDRAHTAHKDPKRIQQRICEGRDLYDGFTATAYTFVDVLRTVGAMRSEKTTVGMPEYVLRNPKKFSYLFPGHCQRPPKPLT